METGSTPDSTAAIEQLHDSLAEQTSGATEAAGLVEAGSNPVAPETSDANPNAGFARETIRAILDSHADSVRTEFERQLEPIKHRAPDQIQRIIDRAPMSEQRRENLTESLVRIAGKYGVLKFVSDEAVAIGSLALYWMELRGLRKDASELIVAHAPKPMQAGPPPAE
jgi:hypothetical protein